jgi:hypothetical protein
MTPDTKSHSPCPTEVELPPRYLLNATWYDKLVYEFSGLPPVEIRIVKDGK